MSSNRLRLAVMAALAGTAGSATQVAWSQQAGGLEEIVVTATRRAMDLQQVPVSIVAITGDNLELQGLDSLEDVGNYIPNVSIQGGALTSSTNFRVRGLPNVGLYVDGIWQVETSGFLVQDFIEVDRVEVLRGPQGTTYGRDAVGGAIRIWTARPDDEFGGQVTATTGSLDRRDIRASVNVPITDKLLTKWTAASMYRDGYIQGLSVDKKFGGFDQEVFRGDMVWTPNDKLSIRFTTSYDENFMTEPKIQDAIFDTRVILGPDLTLGTGDDGEQNWGALPAQFYGLAIEGAQLRPGGAEEVAGLLAFTPENYTSGYPGGRVGKWENTSATTTPTRIQREQTTLDINWDITDNISIDFLTGYTDVASDIINDWDSSDWVIVEDIDRTRLDLFSEEIQISGGGDRVSWVGGVYYWDQADLTRNNRYVLDEFFDHPGEGRPPLLLSDVYATQTCQDLLDPAINTTGASTCQFTASFVRNVFTYDRLNYADQNGWAVFGEATVALTDRLDLTLGIRHHDQENENGAMAFIPGVTAPLPRSSNELHTGGDPFAGTRIPNDSPQVAFDETTYKFALQMQFTDDVMGYISYSEGFDSGGIDSVTTGGTQVWFPYDPQIIENSEIGLRADLADGRVRLNATYFDSDWLNIQNDGVVRDPATGLELPQLATTNVGTANASGLELELTLVPTDKLTFNVNIGILDTGYTFVAPGTSNLDATAEFSQAPDSTYNIGMQYVADLNNGGTWTSRIDYAYTDQFWRSASAFLRMDWYGPKNGGPVPPSYDESGDVGIWNARFAYQPASGDYTFAIFGTNLTNEYLLNSGFFHGIWGYDFASVARPREAGVSLSFNF